MSVWICHIPDGSKLWRLSKENSSYSTARMTLSYPWCWGGGRHPWCWGCRYEFVWEGLFHGLEWALERVFPIIWWPSFCLLPVCVVINFFNASHCSLISDKRCPLLVVQNRMMKYTYARWVLYNLNVCKFKLKIQYTQAFYLHISVCWPLSGASHPRSFPSVPLWRPCQRLHC